MLVYASDLSGNVQNNEKKNHVSFIAGRDDIISKIYNDIGLDEIHMRKLSYKKRLRVLNKMDRLPDGIRAWCFHIGKVSSDIYETMKGLEDPLCQNTT